MKIKTEVLPADQAESIVKAAELLRSGELVNFLFAISFAQGTQPNETLLILALERLLL